MVKPNFYLFIYFWWWAISGIENQERDVMGVIQ